MLQIFCTTRLADRNEFGSQIVMTADNVETKPIVTLSKNEAEIVAMPPNMYFAIFARVFCKPLARSMLKDGSLSCFGSVRNVDNIRDEGDQR
jgi:hypothetical protein